MIAETIARLIGMLIIPVGCGFFVSLFFKKNKITVVVVVASIVMGFAMFGMQKANAGYKQVPESEMRLVIAKLRSALPVQINQIESITAVNYFPASKTLVYRVSSTVPVDQYQPGAQKMMNMLAENMRKDVCSDHRVKVLIQDYGITYAMDYFDPTGNKYFSFKMNRCS